MAKITIVIEAQDKNVKSTVDAVTRSLGKLDDSAKGNSQEVGRLTQGYNQFKSALGAFGVAFAAVGVAKQVVEWRDLGQQVRATENIFENITRPIGDSQMVLESLRSTTRGVVDDMTLMQGANQFLRMGLAGNNDELQRLIGMAVQLKKPTESVTEAIDNFGLMMANQSVLRLDSFGLSSARVRAEIERLTTSLGITREEAFKLAVLSEGEKALMALGGAVAANVTQWDKLGVSISNVMNKIGEFAFDRGEEFATSVNGIGGIAGAILNHDITIPEAFTAATNPEQARADIQARLFQEALSDLAGVSASDFTLPTLDGIGDLNNLQAPSNLIDRDAFKALQEARLQSSVNRGFVITDDFDANKLKAFNAEYFKTLSISEKWANTQAEMKDTGLAFVSNPEESQAIRDKIEAQERLVETLEAEAKIRGVLSVAEMEAMGMGVSGIEARLSPSRLENRMDALAMGPDRVFSAGANLSGNLGFMDSGFLDASGLAEIESIVGQMQSAFATTQSLASQGLITADELARSEAYVGNVENIASLARDAAQAFEDASLSQMMGISDGGRLGEFGDMVAANLPENMSLEDVEAFKTKMGLVTGEITQASLAMENLATSTGGLAGEDQELALQAFQQGLALLEELQLMGTPDAAIGVLLNQYAGSIESLTAGGTASMTGLQASYDAVIASATQLQSANEATSQAAVAQFETINTQVVQVRNTISELASKTHAVNIKLNIDMVGLGAKLLAELLREAGGVLPTNARGTGAGKRGDERLTE